MNSTTKQSLLKQTLLVLVAICLVLVTGCSESNRPQQSENADDSTKTQQVTNVTYQDSEVSVKATADSESAVANDLKGDEDQAQQKNAEKQDDATASVQSSVDSEIKKESSNQRDKLVQEAIDAVAETRNALKALEEKKNDEALSALERVVGKLELLVARDPKLSLVPISQATVIHDLYASVDTVKAAVDRAEELLDDGEVQAARYILADLASEATISVTNLPLATYPAAIKLISPMIDKGEIDDAKLALQAALNTLVITDYTVPLPVIRAQLLLKDAEELAENSARASSENDDLAELLDSARKQLELAEILGYGEQDEYQSMYDQIAEIERKTEEGKSGMGFFDKIKESLSGFRQRVFGE